MNGTLISLTLKVWENSALTFSFLDILTEICPFCTKLFLLGWVWGPLPHFFFFTDLLDRTRYALLKCSAQSRLASFKLGKISF